MHNTCFHCGLPVTDKNPPVLNVQDQQQAFCCLGCKAVCDAIVSSGNVDYYQHRKGKARTFDSSDLPQVLDKLKLYDNEYIQREFIRSSSSTDKSNWKEAWLILEEIRCAACMWLNERTLRNLDGILDVQMDYTGQQARVRWDPEKIKLSDILTAITQIGYYAHPFDPSQRESLNAEQKQRSIQRIIFALILGMAVMQSAIGGYFFNELDAEGNYPLWLRISRWVNVGSTFLILAYPGQLFYRNAWRDLKNKTLGMDVPIVIGLSVAWLGSLYATINGEGDVYFESIAMFVIFLLIARYIELRSRITATAMLDRSAKIIPQTASLSLGGVIQEVPVIELKRGDIIRISPGETVPVDGKLLSSTSSFDESLLTGESLPVVHTKDATILGGSINVEQLIELEVLSSKADSTLNDMHQLTQQSVNYKPYYVDIAEKVAGKFVAIILLIALSTYLYWSWQDSANALSHTISVLIVTCPCALALAAPVALSLGAASLSRFHVLPVRMSAIEKVSHVDTLVFDKTGTLTAGTPKVEQMLCVGDAIETDHSHHPDKKTCLQVSEIIEQGSQHPFGKAIYKFSQKALESPLYREKDKERSQPPTVKSLKQVVGQGIKAVINSPHNKSSKVWRLGNKLFTQAYNTPFSEVLTETLKKQILVWRVKGNSVLYLSNDDGLQAIFFIADPLRKGIKDFIKQAANLGIKRKVILSGDHQQSVLAVANQLNITEAYGGMTPEDKLNWIKLRSLRQEKGDKIMMLGDGINDAPTLAAADVSLTFSDATDLAKNNCDFILLSKDYRQLGNAFKVMKHTRELILQNLGWAVAYNILAVPMAASGLITPWMAAIGMSLSSLLVVLNSLRLKGNRSYD